MTSGDTLREFVAELGLVDHHCHGIVREIERTSFANLASESPWPLPNGADVFDSPTGLGIRAHCARSFGLEPNPPATDYLDARLALGSRDAAQELLSATGIDTYIVDTGHRSDDVTSPGELAQITDAEGYEVIRLEPLAEQVARTGVGAAGFMSQFREQLIDLGRQAVGFKSIIAYRYGLDFDPDRPSEREVTAASDEWLKASDGGREGRLDHPVLLRALLWEAVELQKPIQVHVGWGDDDVVLHRCDPSHMTEFLRRTVDSGAKFTLLHCYPFIREGGFLSHVYPHVYFDTGAAVGWSGPSALTMLRHSVELAPFSKMLFSTDAFGLPELFLTGTELWRLGMTRIFSEWIADGVLADADARRYLRMIASENANTLYALDA